MRLIWHYLKLRVNYQINRVDKRREERYTVRVSKFGFRQREIPLEWTIASCLILIILKLRSV